MGFLLVNIIGRKEWNRGKIKGLGNEGKGVGWSYGISIILYQIATRGE
jgi:hypothetical protein